VSAALLPSVAVTVQEHEDRVVVVEVRRVATMSAMDARSPSAVDRDVEAEPESARLTGRDR